MTFENFSSLVKIDVSIPSTWRGKQFLTFDIDWAHDSVLVDTIELVERAAVPATWFITHATPLIDRLRSNPNFTLGIHPNFNELLLGQRSADCSTAQEIICRFGSEIPEAEWRGFTEAHRECIRSREVSGA